MSKKVEVELVAEIMQKNHLDPVVQKRILEELLSSLEAGAAEKVPAEKKQWVVLASDPEGKLAAVDFVAWVLQIPEEEAPVTVKDKLYRGVYEFNTTRSGRLHPVRAVGEAFEQVPSKYFKAADLTVKTKEPVIVIVTDNKIPVVEVE